MPSFLQRYLHGEYEQVWADLVSLGERVREVPLFEDAMAVAREFARRAWHNASLIYGRLVELGYRFEDSEHALIPAGPDTAKGIERIERELGTLPLSLKAWYEVFDSLDFTQDWEQLKAPGTSEVSGLGSHPCLIMVRPKKARGYWHLYRRRLRLHYRQLATLPDPYWQEQARNASEPEPFLPTGAVASNNDPKGFGLPNQNADGVFYNDGGGDRYLVAEIRRCFKWGGFPFCQWYLKGKRTAPLEARPNAERLIPMLCEGLMPL